MAESAADRPKSKSPKPLRALLPFLKPYRGTLVLALIALVVAAVALLALPVALRNLIDQGMAASSASTSPPCTPPKPHSEGLN